MSVIIPHGSLWVCVVSNNAKAWLLVQYCGPGEGAGKVVAVLRDKVIEGLSTAGRLPSFYVPRHQLKPPMRLERTAQPLLGREEEVQKVMHSLMEYKAAVIWGGPGEGKTSIGMEVGYRLWEAGRCEGGCFMVNLHGAFPLFCTGQELCLP